jgi:NAD(P)-dependent dehydrogenase (short-subunit alcohol dehydrogenase family)
MTATLGDQKKLSPPVDFSKPFDPSKLKGRSVLITGGALGLGNSYVRGFADAGLGSQHFLVLNADTNDWIMKSAPTWHSQILTFQPARNSKWNWKQKGKSMLLVVDISTSIAITPISDSSSRVQFVKADVTDWGELVEAFKAAIRFSPYQTIDVIIPNAGIFDDGVFPVDGGECHLPLV